MRSLALADIEQIRFRWWRGKVVSWISRLGGTGGCVQAWKYAAPGYLPVLRLAGPVPTTLHNSSRIETSRRSRWAKAPQRLYPGQITYGSALISRRLLDNLSQPNHYLATPETSSSPALFTSTRVTWSHIHMVKTLRMLKSNLDNKRDDEPNSLSQAVHCTHWPKWEEVMQAKYDSLIENETWELTFMPENRQIITTRWCFKLRKDWNSQILEYKAWWVARNFKQEESIDFIKTFTAVVKLMSYKYLFGISVKRGYKIRQMVVVTAFWYVFIDEIIYIEQPHLFELNPELVCRLCKALYGL